MRLCGTLWALLVVGVLSLGAPAPMWADIVDGGVSEDADGGASAPVVAPVAGDGVIDTIAELEAALEAGGEVVLGGSITYDNEVDIVITKPVTLDLNGCTVTENYGGINHFMMVIRDGGSLTLKDSKGGGKLCATDSSYGYGIQLFSNSRFIMTGGAIETTQESVDIYTSATDVAIDISSGKIVSSDDNVLGIRGDKNITVNITGGELVGNGRVAAYISSYKENAIDFSMTGGSLSGSGIQCYSGANMVVGGDAVITTSSWKSAILVQSGEAKSTLTVNGGTIESTDGLYGVDIEDNSSVVINGGTIRSGRMEAVGVSDNANVKVTGGNIQAGGSSDPFEIDSTESMVVVSGGTFSKELDQSLLDESVKAKVTGHDGGDVSYFTSVDDAIDAAGGDDTISMVEKDPAATTYKVTLKYTDHSGSVTKTVVLSGSEIPLPTLEDDGWYHFDGWYTSDGVKADSPYVPKADIVLTAKWVNTYVPPVIIPPTKYDVEIPAVEGGKITAKPASAEKGDKVTLTVVLDVGQELRELKATDGAGKAIELTENEDGTFTFTMPGGDVEISAVFGCDGGELCPGHKFPDFDVDEWYHDPMDWAIENGYLKGFDDDGTIRPYGTATRAQVVAVLARIAGADIDAYKDSGFADVSDSDWHARAVAWAAENGIVEGYGDGTYFGPDDPVTREQLAVILMRFAAFQGEDVTGRADLEFPDADFASDWAVDALSWAVSEGLILGDDVTGELSPVDGSARAELVTILMRYVS